MYAANEVAARLRVDTRTGLTWSEANYRTKIVGYNELNAKEEDPTWKKYAQQFQNPLILLLLGKNTICFCFASRCYTTEATIQCRCICQMLLKIEFLCRFGGR